LERLANSGYRDVHPAVDKLREGMRSPLSLGRGAHREQPESRRKEGWDTMALHHAGAGEIVDLRPLGQDLRHAKTSAMVKTEIFEVIRLIIHAGANVPAHEVSGTIMLHCLEGRIVLGLGDTSLEMSAGQWVYLDRGVRHSVEGVEESSLLLTIVADR
jgi:quercetin dioxygenase-like cupin family protein